ncbi:MAG: bifunctional folylpolyglutamate synthase/dihydrofolate synthase [Alistipes sp.]|nr:bifunctional folylpolyglutamate synthase/dihydrofolate synthase [Alistipes sp.]
MTFAQAMDYLETVGKSGSILGLDTIRELLRRLGNPQNRLRFVHIAGTNGKGSTLAYISTILTEAGYRTGRFLSPVIDTYCEKIQIDGEYISTQAVAAITEVVKTACDDMAREGFSQPTLFEIETAMAFLYFLNENVDVVVLETGMGGRDDSTNVIETTICSVITSVSLDHVGVIGNNLREIAECKAGIIKEGAPVVLYGQSAEVEDIVRAKCEEKGSPLVITKKSDLVRKKNNLSGQVFDYGELKGMKTRLLGEHQLYNAAVAVETIKVLNEKGFVVSKEQIRAGIEETVWSGRFEVLCARPLMIMDGAHNPDGARAFAGAVREYLDGFTLIFIMGVLKDKDYPEMIRLTNDLADAIITIDPDNPRALSDTELKDAIEQVKTRNIPVVAAGRIEAGVEMASQIAMQLHHEKTAIVAFGSLSFLGDLKKYLIF